MTTTEIQPQELPAMPPPQHPPIFMVCAFYSIGGYWKVFPENFTYKSNAEKFARELSAGWLHRKIYELK